jgi:hypothetical protein
MLLPLLLLLLNGAAIAASVNGDATSAQPGRAGNRARCE